MTLIPPNRPPVSAPTQGPQFTVTFWGVRGSIATPGHQTARYGGNTSCIEIRCDDTRIIIDAGTGIRRLGAALSASGESKRKPVNLLFTHTHSDHISGLPFFQPIFDPEARLLLHGDATSTPLESTLRTWIGEPYFPIGFDALPSDIAFVPVPSKGSFEVDGVSVRTTTLNHPGSALAFRIEHRGLSYVHASDVEHQGMVSDPALVELCRGATAISYDSMFDEAIDFTPHIGWGHSTWQAGLRLASEANVKVFIATHHAPEHDDAFLDGQQARMHATAPRSIVAKEERTIDLLAL